MEDRNFSCTLHTVVDDAAEAKRLWEIYVAAFASAVTESIQDQLCYSERAFHDALTDPSYRKFVVRVDGAPVGYTFTTLDLERARVAYVNPVRLAACYPSHAGRICYFTCIAIDPAHQRTAAVRTLLLHVAQVVEREDLIMAFDYSTESRARLPDFFLAVLKDAEKRYGWETGGFEYRPLGGQTYGAIEIKRK